MHDVNLECGQINGFFSENQLDNFVSVFKKFHIQDGLGNDCYGVDQSHLGYLWFEKTILQQIKNYFYLDARLIFSILLDCKIPFDLHNDIKPLPESHGRHWRSFLIPISVDNDKNLVSHASTLIFNQAFKSIGAAPDLEDNIANLYHDKISHTNITWLKKFSLKKELVWQAGDLLWWDSELWHVSNNFHNEGFHSKQCIVIHTYVV